METPAKPTLEISDAPSEGIAPPPPEVPVAAVTAVKAPSSQKPPPRGFVTEKPKEDRVKEIVSVMKELRKLSIPLDCPEVMELRSHLNAYINEGTVWEGSVSFLRFGRIAEVSLPRRANKKIEIRLRVPRGGR
jgi:hypothetical protein